MRKKYFEKVIIMYTLFVNLSFSDVRKESINKKKIKNQIVYYLDENKPYTGELYGNKIKENYENGIKHGLFQGFFSDGNELYSYEGRYINGIKHGQWIIKYLTGETRAVLRYNYDKPYGQWTYFYKNKNMEGYESLEDGILHGKVVKYSEGAELLMKVGYVNGLLEGEAIFFYKSEILETVTNFKYGKIDGIIKIFSIGEEQILEGFYKKNKREGEWKFFYKGGDIKTIVNYKNGLKDGEVIIYDKAGIIAQKTEFIKGEELNSLKNKMNQNLELKDPIVERFKKFNRSLNYEKYDRILSEME
ncbi:MAG: toxin-antitoxin system YwqK family antitoxin [Cetobacterium sp.]